jgi:hypothetical protein
MKYSIMGFSQKKIVELWNAHNAKIDCDDLLILRWFSNFRGTGKMKMKMVENTPFYWVDYKTIIEDLPIIDIAPQAVGRRFKKYVDIGLLEQSIDKSRSGSKAYYALKDSYSELLYDKPFKEGADKPFKEGAIYNPSTNNPLTNYPPTNDTVSERRERFKKFWETYPKKAKKPSAEKAFEKLKVSDELLATMLEAIKRSKNSNQWQKEDGRFIPHPATWLNQCQWEDTVDTLGGYNNHSVNGQYVYGGETGGDSEGVGL